MKTHRLIKIFAIMAILFFSSVFAGAPEQGFWKWFEKNDDLLFNFEKDREKIFDELSHEMHKVNPELTFEFGPVEKDGKREFVITAGGAKKAFPAVESLFQTAPKLKRWKFVKFRPRRTPINDLEYGGKSIAAKNVYYKMFKDGEKIGLVLFFDGYNEKERDTFGQLGYLFLDEALGEYDMETKVGFIEFHGRDSKHFQGAKPLSELPSHFDEYLRNKGK